MAFVQKNWVDRISEYPNRRTINDGNVTKQVTVGRDEGTITEAGDAFNASNMNDLEQRIADAVYEGGTMDYTELHDKPEINGNVLTGDKSTSDLGIALTGLADVAISSPTASQFLKYDDVLGKWVNGSGGGGGGGTDNYNDLNNKPSINSVTLSGNKTTADLNISYNDLDDKPTIPAAQVNSDWNAVSGVAEILNKPSLSTVATSGDYDDLLNKPTIPDGLDHYSITEKQVGVWVDGTTPIYELTVVLNSTVSCTAGNTSAAGAWTSLMPWNDSITIIDFTAWNNSGNDKSVWKHLSAQWSNTNKDIRALNIRSTAAGVDGFIMRYFYN